MTDAYMNLDVTQAELERALNGPTSEAIDQELAFLASDLDMLIKRLSHPDTAAWYAGKEHALMSIALSTDLVRSAAKADWPHRAAKLGLRVVGRDGV